jgi:hypothetical protein
MSAKEVRPTTANYAGGTMKQFIVLSLAVALMLSTGGFPTLTHAQTPPSDLKPTFISPTPGVYVNGWPPFTVSYPKEWVTIPSQAPATVFQIEASRPGSYASPVLSITAFGSVLPLEEWAKMFMPVWVSIFPDIKVLSDKPSRLKDGTPAREVETEYVPIIDTMGRSIKNAPKNHALLLATRKDLTWIAIWICDHRGTLGEDVKSIAYSLAFQPHREAPVNVPPDVRAFLDMFCVDMVSHDVTSIMAHFSDRFRFASMNKARLEQFLRNDPTSFIQRVTSYEPTVTVFEAHGDTAYVDGFYLSKATGDANALKRPMMWQQIIKEQGQWKWYGNQK